MKDCEVLQDCNLICIDTNWNANNLSSILELTVRNPIAEVKLRYAASEKYSSVCRREADDSNTKPRYPLVEMKQIESLRYLVY